MRTAKTLIRLCRCPGWSESSLGAHSFCSFCHVLAHMCSVSIIKNKPLIHILCHSIIYKNIHVTHFLKKNYIWTMSSEFGTYRLCEQRRFRRACSSAQSRQNLRCLPIQAVSQEEPSDRKPDPWPFRMAVHALLKFVMTECSKTQIHLTGPICWNLLLQTGFCELPTCNFGV